MRATVTYLGPRSIVVRAADTRKHLATVLRLSDEGKTWRSDLLDSLGATGGRRAVRRGGYQRADDTREWKLAQVRELLGSGEFKAVIDHDEHFIENFLGVDGGGFEWVRADHPDARHDAFDVRMAARAGGGDVFRETIPVETMGNAAALASSGPRRGFGAHHRRRPTSLATSLSAATVVEVPGGQVVPEYDREGLDDGLVSVTVREPDAASPR